MVACLHGELVSVKIVSRVFDAAGENGRFTPWTPSVKGAQKQKPAVNNAQCVFILLPVLPRRLRTKERSQ